MSAKITPLQRLMWAFGAVVHLAILIVCADLYAKTEVEALFAVAALSTVLGAFSTAAALGKVAFRKPPFRRQM